jgi:hypothetical protein
MASVCAPRVTVFAGLMQPGQQRHARGEHSYWNPELDVGQNCLQHRDKPNGMVPEAAAYRRNNSSACHQVMSPAGETGVLKAFDGNGDVRAHLFASRFCGMLYPC